MNKSRLLFCLVSFVIMTLFFGACTQQKPVIYSISELKYSLLANFDEVFFVDPDFYPVAHEGKELENAIKQFPSISENISEFSAIIEHLGLANKEDYTDDEKLLIYREHKYLTYAVQMTPSGDIYNFVLRVGEGNGERIEGTITQSGNIEILRREPSSNTYPICLIGGTLIDTPSGLVPVERLCKGMAVWTVDNSGKRIVTTILKTMVVSTPSSFGVISLRLDDGRVVTASPGHPTVDGKKLGDYFVGDTLDGGLVVLIEYITYDGSATYDLLPNGSTGFYWANGILLKSSLMTD